MEATRVRWSTVENMVSTQWTSTGLCRWKKCFKNKSNPDQWLNLWVWGLKLKLPLTWLLLRIVNSVALTTTWLIFARTGACKIGNPCNIIAKYSCGYILRHFDILISIPSEENGRNMVCQDGKKLICYICGSHDHMLEVSKFDNDSIFFFLQSLIM